jgi:hypothetical protein
MLGSYTARILSLLLLLDSGAACLIGECREGLSLSRGAVCVGADRTSFMAVLPQTLCC